MNSLNTFLSDTALSIALGALFFLAPASCEVETTTPSPVGAPESSASGAPCTIPDFQCCQTWVEAPACKDGTLTCRDGWTTCNADAGDPP